MWVHKVPTPHQCKPPTTEVGPSGEYGKGSIWNCTECGEYLRVVDGEYGLYFRRMTNRQVERALKEARLV